MGGYGALKCMFGQPAQFAGLRHDHRHIMLPRVPLYRSIARPAGTIVHKSVQQIHYSGPKTAIVMLLRGLGEEEARTLLERNDGKVSAAIKEE